MKVIRKPSPDIRHSARAIERDFVDIETIRRRVAKIKNAWSLETVQARAEEGARRRDELESLLLDRLTDTSESEELCDISRHGFSLVG